MKKRHLEGIKGGRENTLKEALKSNFSSYSEKETCPGPPRRGPSTRGAGRTAPASPGPAWSREGPASTHGHPAGGGAIGATAPLLPAHPRHGHPKATLVPTCRAMPCSARPQLLFLPAPVRQLSALLPVTTTKVIFKSSDFKELGVSQESWAQLSGSQ